MNYILFLLLLEVLINFSLEQNENYCDLNHKCEDCTICGSITKNYCSCNLNNIYCKNDDSSNITVLSDFLYYYDGCKTNNGNLENICGNANLDIDIGVNKTINIKSSEYNNFFCFYEVKKIKNNNNDINILIKKEVNYPIYFNIHMIVYYNYDKIKVSSMTNPLSSSNNLELIELDAEKISVYIYPENGENMDKINFSFGIKSGAIKKITYTTNSNNKNMKIVYGLLIGVSSILIIILIICLIKRLRDKKKYHSNPSTTSHMIKKKNSELSISNINKEKMKALFKSELIPKIYHKKNVVNDCFNCTICLEDFKEGLSNIVTTKCKHSFHFKCFKECVWNNILFPKCPNCNNPILEVDNNNTPSNITTNQTSINTYNLQNTNTTFGANDTSN
jgi:hypothetical protein